MSTLTSDVPAETVESEDPWRRLSPRMVWVDAAKALASLIPGGLAMLLMGPSSGLVYPALGIAVVGIWQAIDNWLRWLKTRYRVTDEHIELRTGIVERSHRVVRRDRIRSIDTSAKPRHRIAGLRQVTIGAGQASDESAFELDAVSATEAEWLHDNLIITTSVAAEHEPGESELEHELEPIGGPELISGLNWRWLGFHAFNVWGFLLAAGLFWGAYWLLGMFGIDMADWAVATADRLGMAVAIAILVGVAWLVGVVGMAATFVAEWWGFRLERVTTGADSSLRTSQGLFTTRTVNRDESRLRGIQLMEPLPWRWAGGTDTEVIATGLTSGDFKKNSASQILPKTPFPVARDVAHRVLDHPALDTGLTAHPVAALRRRITWAFATTAVLTGVAWYLTSQGVIPAGWWPVTAVLLVPALGFAVLSWRSLGHARSGRYLVARSGPWYRTTVAIRDDAVIGLTVRQSLFQRRMGLATLTATTAAGTGGYEVIDAAGDELIEFAADLMPHVDIKEAASPTG